MTYQPDPPDEPDIPRPWPDPDDEESAIPYLRSYPTKNLSCRYTHIKKRPLQANVHTCYNSLSPRTRGETIFNTFYHQISRL